MFRLLPELRLRALREVGQNTHNIQAVEVCVIRCSYMRLILSQDRVEEVRARFADKLTECEQRLKALRDCALSFSNLFRSYSP